jgi:hypothetical protein
MHFAIKPLSLLRGLPSCADVTEDAVQFCSRWAASDSAFPERERMPEYFSDYVQHVFIKWHKCGHRNCIPEIAVTRADLAMFRGWEDSIKCSECQAAMDTITAYCEEQAGPKIVRLKDPQK